MIVHVTKNNFDAEVLQSDKPVLVDFFANWCMPCKMLSPVIEEIANETPNAKIVKIDIDEQPELASQFRVMSIPTLMVFKDGKAVETKLGVRPKAEIVEMLNA